MVGDGARHGIGRREVHIAVPGNVEGRHHGIGFVFGDECITFHVIDHAEAIAAAGGLQLVQFAVVQRLANYRCGHCRIATGQGGDGVVHDEIVRDVQLGQVWW
ncbi:hypothetical protein D3C76_1001780 [compost metagenome]